MPTDPKPSTTDPWSVWFFRVVQILGVVVVMNEVFGRVAPRTLGVLVGLAMISGALGIERLIQWWTRR